MIRRFCALWPGAAGCYVVCCLICYIWLSLSVQHTADASDTSQRYGPVQKNETLWRIANRLRPPDISTAQMVIALQQANPHAFANGDIHQLLAGAVLQIPPLNKIRDISLAAAAARLQARPDPPAPPVTLDTIPPDTLSTQINPTHTDQAGSISRIFLVGSIICCLAILLIGLGIWRKRTREQAYPATFVTSATLTPIPVPVRAQPDWLAPPEQAATPAAEVLPAAAEDPLMLVPPDVPQEDTNRIAGIQVTEHPHTK